MAIPPALAQEREFLTITDVAQMLHLSTTTIWRHVRRGELKAIKIGRSYRIRRTDLDALLAAAEVNALASPPASPASEQQSS